MKTAKQILDEIVQPNRADIVNKAFHKHDEREVLKAMESYASQFKPKPKASIENSGSKESIILFGELEEKHYHVEIFNGSIVLNIYKDKELLLAKEFIPEIPKQVDRAEICKLMQGWLIDYCRGGVGKTSARNIVECLLPYLGTPVIDREKAIESIAGTIVELSPFTKHDEQEQKAFKEYSAKIVDALFSANIFK